MIASSMKLNEESTMRRDRKLNALRTKKINEESTVTKVPTFIIKDNNGNIDLNTGSVNKWDNYFKSRS